MHAFPALPELVIARVVCAGGPYRCGDELSIALSPAGIGRLVAHDAAVRAACAALEQAVVPELISVIVLHPALGYGVNDELTVSFVDPHVGRIRAASDSQFGALRGIAAFAPKSALPRVASEEQVTVLPRAYATASPAERACNSSEQQAAAQDGCESARNEAVTVTHERASLPSEPRAIVNEPSIDPSATTRRDETADLPTKARVTAPAEERAVSSRRFATGDPETALMDKRESIVTSRPATFDAAREPGVIVRLDWDRERVRRFVQVVDKLFTIDRLGWYRHVLAMRLLVPDGITCGQSDEGGAATRHLHALRAAAVGAFGKPLLAACMPNFNVTGEWLEALDCAAEARAVAGLRDALLPYVDDDGAAPVPEAGAAQTVGTVTRQELLALGASSVDAFLPILIPATSLDAALAGCLADYRNLLIELFGQTARSSEMVRVNQMTRPNHSLDDRLWQLVGAVSKAFDGYALA